MQTHSETEIEPLRRLTRDIRKSSKSLSGPEVRYLVDAYYQQQENRKVADNQIRSMVESREPHEVIDWLSANTSLLERNIKSVLDAYTDSSRIGSWAKSITGIGPVIAAGLEAHIDIEKAPTVGHIWRFAGLDPTVEWKAKTKRPWNASLKTLCWKIGESFVKVSNNEKDVYGHLWAERKAIEQAKNAEGAFADQAKAKLEKYKIGKTTEAYKYYSDGFLPPAHIHARAKRWAVKLYLSHWHHVAYSIRHGEPPPKPYVLTQEGGHAHMIAPPNWPMG